MKFTFNTIDPITGQDLNNINGNEKELARTEVKKHLAAQGKHILEMYQDDSFTVVKAHGALWVTWDKLPSQTFLDIEL